MIKCSANSWFGDIRFRMGSLGGAMILALFMGCGPKELINSDSGGEPEAKVVRVFNWSDYIAPETLARFEKETGIRVELATFDTQAEMIGRVRSTRTPFDVVVVEDAGLRLFCDLGLLRELDPNRIPNKTNIKPDFAHRPVDPDLRYSMPYHWGTTLLAYRRDQVGDLPATWAVLWDERFAGKIWMLKDVEEILVVADLYAKRHMAGEAADAMERILDLVRKQSRLVGRYADTLAIADGLAAGDCHIGVLYSGDAARAAARNTNMVYVIPEEGARLWVDNLCVLRDAEHPEAAHKFINFLLDGKMAALNANYVRYASPNAAAMADMDPAILNDLQLNPRPEVVERCVFTSMPDAELLSCKYVLWSELSRLAAWRADAPVAEEESVEDGCEARKP
jgi:spermidine/putrescine transport system substrate-binding protein